MLLGICLLSTLTGCGTTANLTGLSTLYNAKVRTASVMGGVQTDGYLIEHPGKLMNSRTDPMEALCLPVALVFDVFLSLVADVMLLPITIPIAAIVGDGPFAPEAHPPSPPKDEPAERPVRRIGKGAR
jgi:hypothetical protein